VVPRRARVSAASPHGATNSAAPYGTTVMVFLSHTTDYKWIDPRVPAASPHGETTARLVRKVGISNTWYNCVCCAPQNLRTATYHKCAVVPRRARIEGPPPHHLVTVDCTAFPSPNPQPDQGQFRAEAISKIHPLLLPLLYSRYRS